MPWLAERWISQRHNEKGMSMSEKTSTYRVVTERGLVATLVDYTQDEAEYVALVVALAQGMTYLQDGTEQDPPKRKVGCSCAHHTDGSVTTFLCPIHADNDPCWTEARVTGKRRKGTVRKGTCTNCGHSSRV